MPAAMADDAGGAWKANAVVVDITPSEAVLLDAGTTDGGICPLCVKILALEDGEGHRAVMITADVLGFSPATVEPLCRRISERTGLDRSQILVAATHNHAGPCLIVTPERRTQEPAAAATTDRYVEKLGSGIEAGAEAALEGLRKSALSWGRGTAGFVMNRRERTPHGIADLPLAPAPDEATLASM